MTNDQNKPHDYPFDEVVVAVEKLIKDGWQVHQKFTCEKCGTRLTISEPNVFYTSGSCDKCGHVTDIKAQGCNYLIIGRIKPQP